jgi:hypothetical protein
VAPGPGGGAAVALGQEGEGALEWQSLDAGGAAALGRRRGGRGVNV